MVAPQTARRSSSDERKRDSCRYFRLVKLARAGRLWKLMSFETSVLTVDTNFGADEKTLKSVFPPGAAIGCRKSRVPAPAAREDLSQKIFRVRTCRAASTTVGLCDKAICT